MNYNDIETRIEDAFAEYIKRQIPRTHECYIVGKDDYEANKIGIYKGIIHEQFINPRIDITVEGYNYEFLANYYMTRNIFAQVKIEMSFNLDEENRTYTVRDYYKDFVGNVMDLFVENDDIVENLNNIGVNGINFFEETYEISNISRGIGTTSENEITKTIIISIKCRPHEIEVNNDNI